MSSQQSELSNKTKQETFSELDELNYCCVISERATEAAFAREHVKHRLKGSNSKDEKTSIEENQI